MVIQKRLTEGRREIYNDDDWREPPDTIGYNTDVPQEDDDKWPVYCPHCNFGNTSLIMNGKFMVYGYFNPAQGFAVDYQEWPKNARWVRFYCAKCKGEIAIEEVALQCQMDKEEFLKYHFNNNNIVEGITHKAKTKAYAY